MDICGIPIYIDPTMEKRTVQLVGKGTPKAYIVAPNLEIIREIIDWNFLKQCGIVSNFAEFKISE